MLASLKISVVDQLDACLPKIGAAALGPPSWCEQRVREIIWLWKILPKTEVSYYKILLKSYKYEYKSLGEHENMGGRHLKVSAFSSYKMSFNPSRIMKLNYEN